ncbi:MAG: AAA family ATPase [Candidatus Nitrosocaldus sp.]
MAVKAARTISKGNIRLEFEGLGPLVRGSVEIKPLTVFIGPNGSGKSYTAMLLYALYKGIGRSTEYFYNLRNINHKRFKKLRTKNDYYNYMYAVLNNIIKDDIYKGLVGVFGDISSIINTNTKRVNIGVSTSIINYRISIGSSHKIRIEKLPTKEDLINILNDVIKDIIKPGRIPREEKAVTIEYILRNELLVSYPINYMPASRSGLLQAYRAVASAIIESAAKLSISSIEMPRLTGVSADFLAQLILLPNKYYGNYRRPKEFQRIIDFLDTQILEGSIDINVMDKKGVITEFVYRDKKFDLTLPIVKAASGIAELAPLALYLKYVVIPNSILILEEPESHLHPELQRKVARLLAMLARNGVRVLITTHSDILLEEFNILMRLNKVSKDKRRELGYMDDEYLPMDHLSAYLFKYDDQLHGYTTIELNVTEDEGIPQEDLTQVALAMGETHARISHITDI